MAEMGVAIDGRAADIHPHMAGMHRLEEFLAAGQGIGDEEIVVKDISEFDDSNLVVNELRKEGITKDHMIVTTNTFIRDSIPITPYVLDNIANTITREALKLLIEKNNEE